MGFYTFYTVHGVTRDIVTDSLEVRGDSTQSMYIVHKKNMYHIQKTMQKGASKMIARQICACVSCETTLLTIQTLFEGRNLLQILDLYFPMIGPHISCCRTGRSIVEVCSFYAPERPFMHLTG